MDTKQTILELKVEAENHIAAFNEVVKKISDLGFKVAPQANNTLYVYRDVREAYGDIYKPQDISNQTANPPQEQRVQ